MNNRVSGRGRRVQVACFTLVVLVLASGMGTTSDARPGASSLPATPVLLQTDRDTADAAQLLRVPPGWSSGLGIPRIEKVSGQAKPQQAKADGSGAKVIHLTFDDGPTVKYTPKVLDLLDEYGAQATFFQVGTSATAHPALTRAVVERGHALGSHTWNHVDLRNLSRQRVNRQITRTSDALEKISGRPITCLRPPYGAVNSRVKSAIRAKHLALKLWDIDPRDWKRPGVRAITRRVVSRADPGDVSLMHDGGGNRSQSVRALERILRKLSKAGYRFETLPGC